MRPQDEMEESNSNYSDAEVRNGRAEAPGLADECVDLVTVAQALHWLDLDPFYGEVARVLRPNGVLAAWCYSYVELGSNLGAILQAFNDDIRPYWSPSRRHVDAGYRDMPFPFHEISTPAFTLEQQFTADAFIGYVRTWSAVRAYVADRGIDPVDQVVAEMRSRWGSAETVRRVKWTLSVRVGKRD